MKTIIYYTQKLFYIERNLPFINLLFSSLAIIITIFLFPEKISQILITFPTYIITLFLIERYILQSKLHPLILINNALLFTALLFFDIKLYNLIAANIILYTISRIFQKKYINPPYNVYALSLLFSLKSLSLKELNMFYIYINHHLYPLPIFFICILTLISIINLYFQPKNIALTLLILFILIYYKSIYSAYFLTFFLPYNNTPPNIVATTIFFSLIIIITVSLSTFLPTLLSLLIAITITTPYYHYYEYL